VLLIGTNNHGCTPDQIADGILSIVDVIREKQNQAEILVLVGFRFRLLKDLKLIIAVHYIVVLI
jgi:hypothetical protein